MRLRYVDLTKYGFRKPISVSEMPLLPDGGIPSGLVPDQFLQDAEERVNFYTRRRGLMRGIMNAVGDLGLAATAKVYWIAAKLTPASVAANSVVEQTFSLSPLSFTDAGNTDLTLGGAQLAAGTNAGAMSWRVTAANTIGGTYVNPTGGGVTPTAGLYAWLVVRSMF